MFDKNFFKRSFEINRRIFISIFLFFLFIGIFFVLDLFFLKKEKENVLIMGSKNGVENQILTEMMAILIERKSSLLVKRKYNLEGTFINFEVLKSKDIDIYVEYTGTAILALLKEKPIFDVEEAYLFVKKEFERKFNIICLKPFGFENNYALMMLKKKAKKLNIESILDLKKHKNLRFGFDHEFISREEFEILKKEYDLRFKKVKVMDHILLYLSLNNESIDVIDGYTTDAGILYYDLKILEDVKNVLPRHIAIPLVRGEILEKYPYLKDIINKLGGSISNEEMQMMNYEMDYKGKSAKSVAEKFLKKKKLL